MYKNIFSQLSEAQRKRSDANQTAEEQQEVEMLLSLRNDKTNADEAVIFVKIIMWGLTTFMVYLGFEYYSKTFAEMFSPEAALVFAISLPAVIEIAKIKLIGKFFRAWFFGWIGTKQHWSAVLYWLIIGTIGISAFWWSYTISTGGIREVAKQNAETKNRQCELHLQISTATAGVDAQIYALQKSNEDAGSLKNKRGRTNWASQPILSSNAQSLSYLFAQKEQIAKQVTENYQKTEGDVKIKVSAWAQFIERFGGWGELGVFICLCAVAFFERRLYEANKDAVKEAENELSKMSVAASPPSSPPPPHQHNGNSHQHQAYQNKGRFTYFNRQQDGAVRSALEKEDAQPDKIPVSQFQEPVTQSDDPVAGNYADDVLKLAEKKLRGFSANFGRKWGYDDTVARNIHDILDQTLYKMKGTFRPSAEVHAKFSAYVLDTLFPLLLQKGFVYPKQTRFEGWLRSVAPMPVG